MDVRTWHPEKNPHPDHKDRCTGRSYRTCLRAVLAASEKSDQKIIVIFPTHSVARGHFNTIKSILRYVHGVKFHSSGRALLPNGSEIVVRGAGEELAGLECTVIHDHVFP